MVLASHVNETIKKHLLAELFRRYVLGTKRETWAKQLFLKGCEEGWITPSTFSAALNVSVHINAVWNNLRGLIEHHIHEHLPKPFFNLLYAWHSNVTIESIDLTLMAMGRLNLPIEIEKAAVVSTLNAVNEGVKTGRLKKYDVGKFIKMARLFGAPKELIKELEKIHKEISNKLQSPNDIKDISTRG